MIQKFNDLYLCKQLQNNLVDKGYETPSPIQYQAIPHLLKGRDLLGCAQTGTGKTAAFALPILNSLHTNSDVPRAFTTRALILTPTRELAAQVADSFKIYGKGLGLKIVKVFGGVGFSSQIAELRRGTDILVACPGRLLDLKKQGYYRPDGVKCLVLDEADRMLDMGFQKDVQKIVNELSSKRQTILFSATMPDSVTRFASALLKNPVEVKVDKVSSTAEKVQQTLCFVSKQEKRNALKLTLSEQMKHEGALCLVFSKTKHGANRLVRELEKVNIKADAIHGNKSQSARQRALENFKSKKTRVLVATDVAARGIDVKGITLVINYDLPSVAEDYVHRVGRTARAGAGGQAISYCCEDDYKELKQIHRLLNEAIHIDRKSPSHSMSVEQNYMSQKSNSPRKRSTNSRPNKNKRRTKSSAGKF
jgi:ATP-dependent RNA helicase RhlE